MAANILIPELPMNKLSVEVPEACFTSITSSSAHNLLSLAGRRTSAILSYSDSTLKLVQRILDENTDENLLCTEFFVMNGEAHLAVGGELGILKILNLTKALFVGHLKGHGGMITEIKNLDNRYILSCSEDTTIRMWDVEAMRCVCIFGGYHGHRDYVLSIDISPDGEYLASSGTDCTIKVWRMPRALGRLNYVHLPIYSSSKIHRSFIRCLRFYGNLIVSSSKGNRIAAILPRYSEAGPSGETVFIGEIALGSDLVRKFEIHEDVLVALTKNREIVLYDMRGLGFSASGLAVPTQEMHEIVDFAVGSGRVFLLCGNSHVSGLRLDLGRFKRQTQQD
jgi:polycomb protein EED